MHERNYNRDHGQPELTPVELRILANKAKLYGRMNNVPNPHDQQRDKPLPHTYVLALDQQYVASLDRFNEVLPRNYLEQIHAVTIEHAEARIDELDNNMLLDPYVAVYIHKSIIGEDTPVDGIDMVTECYFSLKTDGVRFVIDFYGDIGEKKRTLSYDDLQLLQRIVKGD